MREMKQTAMKRHIEWLKCRVAISKELEETLLNEEKEQIIEAVNFNDKININVVNNVIYKIKPSCKMLFEYDGKAGIEYYNNTFTT
jgi:hypothetical protein